MEHSALHALQLCGMVVAVGGTIFMLAIFFPACRKVSRDGTLPEFADKLEACVTRWIFLAAFFGAIACFLNLFVDVAEAEYKTIFAGVNLATVWRFATITHVGRLSVGRIIAMFLMAGAVRLPGRAKWWLVALFGLIAVGFAGFVCHAAAQPTGRGVAITVEYAHLIAASIWLGPLVHLLLARRIIQSATADGDIQLLSDVVRRFSPVAFSMVILIGASGVIAAVRFLVNPSAVPTSAYGLTLMVKMLFIIPLLYAGYVNYKKIRPALLAVKSETSITERQSLLQRFGRMLELEVSTGLLVLIVAGILASVSPPRGEPYLTLTDAQAHDLFMTAHLPQTQIANPQVFYGAVERTVDDLRYAEFTHNWSGIAVLTLGLCWLLQSRGGPYSGSVGRIWPFCLIPFAIFIAVAADPEVWILRKVSLADAFRDPTLVEHQIGAIMVFILAWLGWRDMKRPPEKRPLGYALPILMIFGSLLLLGHAHSNYNTSQELTNLINVQHAFFGMFGLFAGTIRWFNLRGVISDRFSRVAWPSFVIVLGLFMAFCYREVV
ncbi:MAG TPA: CopD family protein [Verrucomicrobiae bacterium]|nr:CopD family protein [Verrucomicrobiae bacterium]